MIVKGQIELVSDFKILSVGGEVSPSAAVLLPKLSIWSFECGMGAQHVFFWVGCFLAAAVLDAKEEVLINKLTTQSRDTTGQVCSLFSQWVVEHCYHCMPASSF